MLYITLSYTINKSQYKYRLRQQLYCGKEGFEIVSFEKKDGEKTEIALRFHTVYLAKRAKNLLCKFKSVKVSVNGFLSNQLLKQIADIRDDFLKKQRRYNAEHQDKIKTLEDKIAKLKANTANISIEQLDIVMDEIKALEHQKNEKVQQKREFQMYCEMLHKEINESEANILDIKPDLSLLKKKVEIECLKFHNALPIYAKRQYIIDAVTGSQVTILIGETGSGKSTQVVQYLYDAGFATDGLIVCTQPRKVAAITLANRVSEEMCSTPGELVGYRVGNSAKMSPRTKIVYMTDHSLLNDVIADRLFMKYSCLVIDEAHERSLSTDILLACIKQCLPNRPQLKILITSATIDPQLFIKFFNECPVMKVSGRNFPVDVVWNPLSSNPHESPTSRDYVRDVVKVAKQIHEQEPPGDILAFLTSASEIERACQLAQNEMVADECKFLPLHGRLPAEDQKLVFETFDGMRKIVFATNVAETSVTIPGVKYIIDTGLAKELCLDAKRNMNSLEICMISKSSAEQRKGRAGRVSAGKCYRLYAQEQFEAMQSRSAPEILRVHLSLAVLKLYEFGITDVLEFDFLEMPDKESLRRAVIVLNKIGATNSDKITQLGTKLAALPIDPLLGKILLDGIDAGVGQEAAVVVSVSSLGGNIFFRGGSQEMKMESDRMKVQFIHQGGDHLTSLNCYKEWSLLKVDKRNKWCVKNFVNAKSMRTIEETIKDITHILSQKFTILLPREIDLSAAEVKLPKILFTAFCDNVAVYLGHERVGYMPVQAPGNCLMMFPGSALVHYNLVPKYIIYEKSLRISQNFLLQTMPVEEEWIEEALANGRIDGDALSNLKQEYTVTPLSIPVGKRAYDRVIRRNCKSITDDLTNAADCKPLYIAMKPELSTIVVFTNESVHKKIQSCLDRKLSKIREELIKQLSPENGITCSKDDVRITLRAGGEVENVIMPYHYKRVVLKSNLTDTTWKNEVLEELSEYGEISSDYLQVFAKTSHLHVTFKTHEAASKAVELYQTKLPEFVSYIRSDLPSQPRKGPTESNTFTLQLEWTRRQRRGFGFLIFESEDDAQVALDILQEAEMVDFDFQFDFQTSKKNSNEIFVGDIPSTVSEIELEELCYELLQEDGEDIDFEVKCPLDKPFQTTLDDLNVFKQELHYVLGRFSHSDNYILNLPPPQDYHSKFRAYIEFTEHKEGHKVWRKLVKHPIHVDGNLVEAQITLSSTIRCSRNIYKVLQKPIESLQSRLKSEFGDSLTISIKTDKVKNAFIDVSAKETDAFTTAKDAISNLNSPQIIPIQHTYAQQYLSSRMCKENIAKIQNDSSTYLYINSANMTIDIYGEEDSKSKAASMLEEQLKVFNEDYYKVEEINLRGPDQPPGLMKHLISVFGSDLNGITSLTGVLTVSLNPQRQILTLLAKCEPIEYVVRKLQDYNPKAVVVSKSSTSTIDAQECCVCMCEIDDIRDVFVMEYCCHMYHRECIEVQISTNSIKIPLLCAAEGCSSPFVWQDFENLFKRTDLTVEMLIDVSLKAYLPANRDKARTCPTPDCKMIYTPSKDGQRFVCCLCNINICTTCHVQFHDGMSCEWYQSKLSAENDSEVNDWLISHGGKRCPKCFTPIEKIGGCNHMTCDKCHSHLCWICLKIFPNSNDCYEHLSNKHHDGINIG
jgi:ATP-dependent RNA helicase DHX8/PRP22